MKRKLFSYIRPSLTLLDNGRFFNKPIGWLYAAIAVFSLLLAVFLVYTTIWWNNSYQKTSESRKVYQEVLLPEYQKMKYAHDTLTKIVVNYGKVMNNAIDCLNDATKQADYYGTYASYGPEYKQIYTNALDVQHQWELAFKDASDRWDLANSKLDVIKPKYEKLKRHFQKAEKEYLDSKSVFDMVDQFGTVIKGNDAPRGKIIVGIILYSFMVFLVGILNFLLWWSRFLDLKTLIRVQDKFVVTPIAAHFLQTFGESLGIIVSIWGFFAELIQQVCHLTVGQFGLSYTQFGVFSIFIPIVVGFLIAFVFRIVAELLKAVVVIANNTGK